MASVIGVDSSTQSCTVERRDLDTGRLLASASQVHPAVTPPRSEVDPEHWWDALAPLLADHADGIAAISVAAISVAAQQHGMVALDGDRRPVHPAKLWNDTESAPQAAALVEALGASAWASRTGSVPVAATTISKVAWLRDHAPAAHARIRSVLLPHDWLTMRLTGELVSDRGDASGTGAFSPADGTWDRDVLDLVGLGIEVCPEVLGPTDLAGRWGSVLVAPGTGDNMAAALGMGLEPGDVAISIGTSGVVSTTSDAPTADASGAVSGFADATGRYLPLVCTLNAAKVLDASARLLGDDHVGLSQLALDAPAGAGGLVLVPYFDGERTPNRPDATGRLVGLRSNVSRAQLARAAIEGVVCGLVDAWQALAAAGVATQGGRVLVVGGGARSEAVTQVLADLIGRPVEVLDDADHVAAGACVQAAAVAAHAAPLDVAAAWQLGKGRTVEPDPQVDADGVLARYRAAAAHG